MAVLTEASAKPARRNAGMAGRRPLLLKPSRALIMGVLLEGPLHVRGIARLTGLNPSTISRILRKMEGEGLVVSRVEGKRRVYEMSDEGRRELAFAVYELDLAFSIQGTVRSVLGVPKNTLPAGCLQVVEAGW
ncbi:MAG: winged helix-turn-helix domain-containing protein [Candidatus Freyarchaeota archaeon]